MFNKCNDFNIWRRGAMVKGRMQIKGLHTWDFWMSSSFVTSPTQSKWGQSQLDTGAIVHLQIWNKRFGWEHLLQVRAYILDKYMVSCFIYINLYSTAECWFVNLVILAIIKSTGRVKCVTFICIFHLLHNVGRQKQNFARQMFRISHTIGLVV